MKSILIVRISNSCVHDYTVYADCLHNPIKEKFYYFPPNVEFTKSISRNILKKHAAWIPIEIFQSREWLREPTGGWINNEFGSIEITAGMLMRLMRTHHYDQSVEANLVSGDLVTNGLPRLVPETLRQMSLFTRKHLSSLKYIIFQVQERYFHLQL
ncbi:fatty acyl-CoA reductase wat-like [Vespula squamosa]|uniref:Fatty acyl-CoA reductase wat-like n=1 Tax=Vespula squamosa TaxID=30214 RepID=A0ABD2BHJ1_VESSQ